MISQTLLSGNTNITIPINENEFFRGEEVSPFKLFPVEYSIDIRTEFCPVYNAEYNISPTRPQMLTKFHSTVYLDTGRAGMDKAVVYQSVEFSYERAFEVCMNFIRQQLSKCEELSYEKDED